MPGDRDLKPIADAPEDLYPDHLDQLQGGMRIETNIWITREATRGNIDLTRLALRRGTNL